MSGGSASDPQTDLRNQLLADIDDFAAEFVENDSYHCKTCRQQPKIIHDPLWGTIRLNPWEVMLLDLPLFQRLRQIRQTSLVSYVFPGCTHTRFEHTLGVLQQTQRLVDAVNATCAPDKLHFEPSVVRDLRLAALFHDCGHSCLSHISEDLFARCEDMRAWFAGPAATKCNPHEALSALILKSMPVRKFLQKIDTKFNINLDPDKAANWIMGAKEGVGTEPKCRYVGQVINGPFDADKLDYIFRDSHYSGIPLGLDLYRLWASCQVKPIDADKDGLKVLALNQASVAPLEQILFNKTNLFAIVYQHPKVRAAERMFQSIIEEVQDSGDEKFITSGRPLTFKKAVDFLWFTDDTFFAEALRRPISDPIHKRIHAIRYRRLLVRALTISHDTIEEDSLSAAGYSQLRKLNQRGTETYNARRDIAKQIIAQAGLTETVQPGDVWVDIPGDPSYGEADRTFVITPANKMRKLSELFPVHYWSDLFAKHKWRGHVFCPSEYQQAIHEAAITVFWNKYKISFRSSAGESAHVEKAKSTSELVKPAK